ncbi:hypothetical protein C8A03DRAFT_41707 [Achaetomium macrosporum]|uniref:Uncharacterized protein n=1 Tax=Achaetomium macrosporum TaxID=79813 RepID=A0AAN7CFR2_9PEZI|nr:hypothetical protein C8A03DRAFT_41707 [Achaetomium macrosporum]
MCYREFIAYQCGHRSMVVLRPCPLTTAGHNFPVCSLTPSKPTYAETMCPACERQLHSRWVLIREWEHRWLHERGVCGCDVIFPGLLTTPRVIGETSTVAPTQHPPGTVASTSAKLGDNREPRPADSGSSSSQGDVNKTIGSVPGDNQIPPLFTEEVTSSGEHRVVVRLSSLYAAEWKADHRALHEAGECSCPTTFNAFQPHIREEEMTSHDRHTLRKWRELEGELEKNRNGVRDIDNQNEDTLRRIAEIEKVFGKFTMDGESPTVNLPRLAGPSTAENQAVEAKGQGNGRQRNSRHDNNRFGEGPSRPQNQSQPAPSGSSSSSNANQGQGELVLASQAPTPYNAYALATAQGYHYPYQATAAYPLFPELPPYQQPYYFMPAHPTYATAATYTDSIPPGAYPWATETQPTPGMPWITQGPGPYRTPGLIYDDMAFAAPAQYPQAGQGQSQPPVPVQRLLPAPEIVVKGKGKGKEKEVQAIANPNQPDQLTLPLCGLPIGAGPEGTSHMPSWLGCPLRRSLSVCSLTRDEGEGETAARGADEREEEEQEEEEQEENEGAVEDDSDNLLPPTPPTPPQRCHSAAP